MVIVRVEEIRKMKGTERQKELSELKAELSSLMSKTAMGGSLENPARVGLIRKTIARFYTIEREEELGIRKAEPAKEKVKGKQKEKEKKKEAEAETVEKKAKEPKKRKAPKKEEAGGETLPEAVAEEPSAEENEE